MGTSPIHTLTSTAIPSTDSGSARGDLLLLAYLDLKALADLGMDVCLDGCRHLDGHGNAITDRGLQLAGVDAAVDVDSEHVACGERDGVGALKDFVLHCAFAGGVLIGFGAADTQLILGRVKPETCHAVDLGPRINRGQPSEGDREAPPLGGGGQNRR